MQTLRQYISRVLKEATTLPDKFYAPLEQVISASQFWLLPNGPNDPDFNRVGGEDVDQTEAAAELGSVLMDYFRKIKYPLYAIVRSPDVEYGENHRCLGGQDHLSYPNGIVVGGQMGLTSTGRRLLYLDLMIFDEDFNVEDISPSAVVSNIASVIRHELIHSAQYDKRSKEQGLTRAQAKRAYEEDGSIVSSNDRHQYLSSHIEVDAYAHEFAEQLLRDYGLERAKSIIRGARNARDLNLSDQLEEYLEGASSEKAFKNLMGKIYTHLIDLTDRKIY